MDDRTDDNFSLDQLLHPANAFGHLSEVLNDADLTLNEKRSILASWASDACAVEAAPDLRAGPLGATVRFDGYHGGIADPRQTGKRRQYRRVLHRRRVFQRFGRDGDRNTGTWLQ